MSLRGLLSRSYHRTRHSLRYFRHETSLQDFVARGHYYSPLPDIDEGAAHADEMSRRSPDDGLADINLNADGQERLLGQMADVASEFDWPDRQNADRRYYCDQPWYGKPDGFVLYSIFRLLKPRRVIEIGSGFSSALMLDIRELKAETKPDLIFIDPSPDRLTMLLKPGDEGTFTFRATKVQDVQTSVFETLSSGDLLFVDSSHVARAGSDVNHIVFNILPHLAPGVLVHFHDIYWPFEYPANLLRRGLAWNEAYLVRSFLMFNEQFEILFWAPYATAIAAPAAGRSLSVFRLPEGQSIWIRRIR